MISAELALLIFDGNDIDVKPISTVVEAVSAVIVDFEMMPLYNHEKFLSTRLILSLM